VFVVASSGIASLLLLGGRTTHSRFKIPIDLHDESTCNITQQMKVAGWRLEGLDKDLHKVFFDSGAGTSSNFVR